MISTYHDVIYDRTTTSTAWQMEAEHLIFCWQKLLYSTTINFIYTGSSRHFFFFHKHRTPALVIAFLQLKSPSLSNCWNNVTNARVRRWWNMYLTSFHCINFYQISEIVIFYASVKINDAETDTCMCITLSFNTCTIKPLGIINELFIPFFHRIWNS